MALAIPVNVTQWEMMMMKDIAPTLGVFTSSGLGFGPLPAIMSCRKAGTLGEVNPDPFPILLGNAMGWIMYAAAARNYYIFAANVSLGVLFFLPVVTFYLLTRIGYVGLQRPPRVLLCVDRIFLDRFSICSPKDGDHVFVFSITVDGCWIFLRDVR